MRCTRSEICNAKEETCNSGCNAKEDYQTCVDKCIMDWYTCEGMASAHSAARTVDETLTVGMLRYV